MAKRADIHHVSVAGQGRDDHRTRAAASFSKYDTSCVKGLAILLMIVHHCFLDPDRYKGQVVDFAPLSEPRFNAIALSFKICVGIFVFISGYGITCSLLKVRESGHYTRSEIVVSVAKRLVSLIGGYLFVFVLAQLWSLLVVRDGRWLEIYGPGALGVLHCVVDGLGLGELFGMPLFLATFWYMSLAILIVVLVPILFDAAHRYGYAIVFFLAILFRVLFKPVQGATIAYLPNYLACVVAGMWAAEEGLIARFEELQLCRSRLASDVLKGVGAVVVGVVFLYLRQKTRGTAMLPFWDAVLALMICCVMHTWVDRVPGINAALAFIGKHSMNIFLAHNFVRIVWYYDFTYSFKSWWLITLVLLGISVVISVVIEALKKLVRYDKLLLGLRARLTCATCGNE